MTLWSRVHDSTPEFGLSEPSLAWASGPDCGLSRSPGPPHGKSYVVNLGSFASDRGWSSVGQRHAVHDECAPSSFLSNGVIYGRSSL